MATSGIPGLDVIEGFPLEPSKEATAARQAAAARAAGRSTPVAEALSEAKRNPNLGLRAGSVLDTDVGSAAKRGLQGAGNAVRGAASSVASGLGRIAAPIGLGFTAAQVANTGTDDYYQRTGIDREATVVPQAVKDVGVRALGAFQDLGNNLTGNLADRLGNGLAGNGFGPSSALSATPVLPSPSIPASPMRAPTAEAPPPAPATVQPSPSAFPPVEGGLGGNSGFAPNGISVTPTLGINTQSALSTAMSDAAGRIDPGVSGGGIASLGGGGANGFGTMEERAAQVREGERNFLLRQGLNSQNKGVRDASARGIAEGDQARGASSNAAAQERIAMARERGETARATALNANNRAIRSEENEVSLRGQDIAAGTARSANRLAAMRDQRQQANEDRRFEQEGLRFADESAGRASDRRASAVKNVQTEIETMIPPGPDGKPDTANAARYAQGMNVAVSNLMKSADPTTRARLEKDGMNALDARDKQRIVAGMQLTDVVSATATGGLTPWGTTAIKSNAPIMAIRKNADGDYETDRRGPNGEKEVIPARYVEKEGSSFGLGGTASNKFTALMGK